MLSRNPTAVRIFASMAFLFSAALNTACSDQNDGVTSSIEPVRSDDVVPTVEALSAAPVLNMTMQPGSITYGQSALFTYAVQMAGKPVANTQIEVWFSGSSGSQSGHSFLKTDSRGMASKTLRLSSNFPSKWVDMNLAVPAIGGYKNWRIKR